MEKLSELLKEISKIKDLDLKVSAINEIKKELHRISPFKNEPVDCVIWVKNEKVEANDYNPNSVAPPEMALLAVSIGEDGYTQPIVAFDEETKYTVIDGFHRNRVGKENKDIQARIKGYLPLSIINSSQTGREDRIASTIRHNRARGKHRVDSMSEIVVELKKRNWSDKKISKHLGMDADEILRLCQVSGLAEMFADKEFNNAWELDVINENDTLETEEVED